MDNLKNCPFCGEKVIVKGAKYNTLGMYGNSETEKHWYAVYCPKCKISQPKKTYFSKDDAVKAWNKRAEAKLETGWISVNDRLPPKESPDYSADVIVTDGKHTSIGYYIYRTGNWIQYYDDFPFRDISHWSPIPELPEEVSEE